MQRVIMTVVGARPQFVKAAALSRALAAEPRVDEVMVHTGQHHDHGMSEIFFEELSIAPPAINLGIHGGRHGEMTAAMLMGIETAIVDHSPDLVVVYGDTNSTLAAALAAAKLHVPVAHVEAGLRSFNRQMPEEINRVVTDHVSELLLCPTTASVDLLAAEGITHGVHHVGDVMYDATLHALARARRTSTIREELDLVDGKYALATVHRAENTDDRNRLDEVVRYLRDQATDQTVVLPLHPRTAAALERHGLVLDPIVVIEPVGYLDMTALLDGAALVLTDSGGLQKEAYFHRVPCITLREETEWTETVDAGWNRLWHQPAFDRPRRDIDDYGDGTASERITSILVERLDRPVSPPAL